MCSKPHTWFLSEERGCPQIVEWNGWVASGRLWLHVRSDKVRCPSWEHGQVTLAQVARKLEVDDSILFHSTGLLCQMRVSFSKRWIDATWILPEQSNQSYEAISITYRSPSSKLNFKAFFLSWGQYLRTMRYEWSNQG